MASSLSEIDKDNELFLHSVNDVSFSACLRGMSISLVRFSKIHSEEVFPDQVANAHETYLPTVLEWNSINEANVSLNVNELFSKDFTMYHGNYDPLAQIHKPKVFVIFGSRGAGKSALLNYYMYQWIFPEANDVKNIKDFHLVYIINVAKILTKPDLIKVMGGLRFEYFPIGVNIGTITAELQQAKILWLVDGFERASRIGRKIVLDLITEFPNSQVVITTRWSGVQFMNELFSGLDHNVPTVTLTLKAPTGDAWKLLVPKMIACITNRREIIEEASTNFIAELEGSCSRIAGLFPLDLALLLKPWLYERYSFFEGDMADHKVEISD